jgi:hypothetical protein
MNIGITEAVIRGRRGFYSQYELKQLLENVLSIYPLGKIYKQIKVLEPISFQSERIFVPKMGIMDDLFSSELFSFSKTDKAFRRMHQIHVLVLCLKSHESMFVGNVIAHGNRLGEGMFYITEPCSKLIAHEIGHLLKLNHLNPGLKKSDIMDLDYERIREAEGFCVSNEKKMMHNASWPRKRFHRSLNGRQLIEI